MQNKQWNRFWKLLDPQCHKLKNVPLYMSYSMTLFFKVGGIFYDSRYEVGSFCALCIYTFYEILSSERSERI